MKKLWLGILATMLMALFVAPAFAWEFEMAGDFEYRLNYLSRIGEKDLFGNASMQDNYTLIPGAARPTPAIPTFANNYIGFAGPNIYENGFTGTIVNDAAATSGVAITRGGYSTMGL